MPDPDIVARLYGVKREIEDIIDELDTADAPEPEPADGPKLAVVVGHTKRSPGAFGEEPVGQNEYYWNRSLAALMKDHAAAQALALEVFFRDNGGIAGAYSRAGEWGADGCIELHFNAATPAASGTETIVVSEISKPLAEAVQGAMVETLGLRDRGVKEPWEGRGRHSLTQLPVPSVLIEPFFGSNPGDCHRADEQKDRLAAALVDAAAAVLLV
jgi:N-acetylmuramoyl-L-alanine amidase